MQSFILWHSLQAWCYSSSAVPCQSFAWTSVGISLSSSAAFYLSSFSQWMNTGAKPSMKRLLICHLAILCCLKWAMGMKESYGCERSGQLESLQQSRSWSFHGLTHLHTWTLAEITCWRRPIMALISISNGQTKANHCNKVQASPPYFLLQAWVLQKAEMLWNIKSSCPCQ